MTSLETRTLEEAPSVTAPDGSLVHILAACARGSMARFALDPGCTSKAVRHRTVEELWYVIGGHGEMWRSGETTIITSLAPGVSLSIPAGVSFQFRASGETPLHVIGVTMPPWPGMDEAETVPGYW